MLVILGLEGEFHLLCFLANVKWNITCGGLIGGFYFCEIPCIPWFSLCQVVSYCKGFRAY